VVSITLPIIAASNLGRMGLLWPDYLDPGGSSTNTDRKVAAITELSDNLATRISEYSAIADSTTETLTHNFGVDVSELSILFYTGIGDSKILVDSDIAGYTIANNGGDPKNIIDITTPGSGGPHSFTVSLSWGGGGSGGSSGGVTKNYVLGTDLNQGDFVNVYDSGGGVAKIRGVVTQDAQAVSYSNSIASDGGTSVSVASTKDAGKFAVFYTASNDGPKMKVRVLDYNAGSPTYGAAITIDAGQSYFACAVYNPKQDNIVLMYNQNNIVNIAVLTVSGTSVTIESSTTIPSLDIKDEGSCVYNPVQDAAVFAIQDDTTPDVGVMFSISSIGNAITVGSTLAMTTVISRSVEVIYSKTYDSLLVALSTNSYVQSYYLYRQTDLDSYTLLDSDLTSVLQIDFNDLSDDLSGGGILNLYQDFVDAGTYYKAIDISTDLIVISSATQLSTFGTGWRPRSFYNSQLEKVVTTYTDSSGLRLSNTVTVSPTAATFDTGTSTVQQISTNSGTGKSKNINRQFVACGRNSSATTEVLCDFRGGDVNRVVSNSIGVLVSDDPNTAGNIGAVSLRGGVWDIGTLTGAIGAFGYIGEDGTIDSSSFYNEKPIGIFLEGNIFQIDGLIGPIPEYVPIDNSDYERIVVDLTGVGSFTSGYLVCIRDRTLVTLYISDVVHASSTTPFASGIVPINCRPTVDDFMVSNVITVGAFDIAAMEVFNNGLLRLNYFDHSGTAVAKSSPAGSGSIVFDNGLRL